jgi:hypothetical protein
LLLIEIIKNGTKARENA